MAKNENVLKRIEMVKQIVEEKYEPGNQSKSKIQVYRQHITKVYPMGERTFRRYMTTDVDATRKEALCGQMCLEFN